jgi:hypothetical protein
MELDLKALGITLLVGAFTIIGIEAIAYFLFNKRPIGFIAGKFSFEVNDQSTGQKDRTLTLVVLLLFAFGAGIVFENLSLKAVESDQIPFRTIPAKILGNPLANALALPRTTDDRVLALIGNFEKPTPLGRDLAQNNAFRIHGSAEDAKVEEWINKGMRGNPEEDPGREAIEKSIVNLYYFAKNTAYGQEQHYDELSKIQERYEVLMSLSMLAFIFFFGATVVGSPLYIKRYLDRNKKKGDKRLRELHGRIPIVVVSFLLMYLVCLSAFARESDAFNKRAFGYLSTMLIAEKRQVPEQAKPTPSPAGTPR